MADAQRLAAAREAVNLINKNLKSEYGLVASFLGDAPREVETISSGSLALDAALGGGLAVGRLVEIYGPESSGKTTMALNAVANVQAAGDMAAFIDLENALDPSYARILGVNTDELLLSQPDHGEQAMDLITALIESQAFKIIVVDSVAALITKAEMENSAENVTIGSVARLLSTSLKRIVPMAARHGVTMVFIPSVSTFVISRLLGGGKTLLLGDLIEMQFLGSAYNPHLGSAISLVMMVIVLICMGVMNRFGEGEGEAVLL